jgi:hypothetical protein
MGQMLPKAEEAPAISAFFNNGPPEVDTQLVD